ncbi:MAG: DEAD/DEAH box helicase [Ferrovum sp.]|nr:DEAD/DEAH box helicase [Ferrovum sp.]
MTFDSLGLSPELLRAIHEEGYTTPTPVQSQAIPLILEGKDVQAAAQTGTGKTAGFTLPILHRLQPMASSSPSPARHPIRCLVLTPTRELAAQVEQSVRTYSRHIPLRTAVIYGGVNMDPQIKALQAGVEIVVATPGRLLDHVQQKTINLSQVEILVLDEADRMLDMGFIPDIRRILALLPARRQNLLFSATFSEDIKKLSAGILHNPVTVEVARPNETASLVTQVVYPVHQERKRALLIHLIRTLPIPQAIVFSRTKHGANRLCHQLEKDGIPAAAIHSDKTQAHRMRSLEQFKAGEVNILVATDIAARGLDIDQLPFVINFDLPHVPEDYVHRIGRTGRAGSKGHALSLVCPEEVREREAIEKLIKQPIPEERLAEFGQPVEEVREVRGESRQRAQDSRPRPERRGERPSAAPVEISHQETDEGQEAKVPRQPKHTPRSVFSHQHFSRPPLGLNGIKKSREIPALLGGLLKKTS